MSTIDKQRIAAVRKLEQLCFTFAGNDWMHPTNGAAPAPAITDALHAVRWPTGKVAGGKG